MKTLTARNPSEARGIRKALKAAGVKFEFKSTAARGKRKKNGFARTKAGAQKRVQMKRALRSAGISVASDIPTKKLAKLYRQLKKRS